MQRLFFATIALIISSLSAQAEVKCQKLDNLPRADKSSHMLLAVERAPITGYEKESYGYAMVELFGLAADQARDTGDGNIEFVEACEIDGGRLRTLRFKIRAFSQFDGEKKIVADVPVPHGMKDATIRWCSKAEQRCLEGKYFSDDKTVWLDEVAGAKQRRSKLQ